MSKTCIICGDNFEPTGRNQKMCSDPCRKIVHRQSQKKYQRSLKGRQCFKKSKLKYRASERGRLTEKKYTIRYKKNKHIITLCNKYGITPERYLSMVDEQQGLCAICGQPETKLYKGNIQNLSLDHDHETNKIRGLLCDKCDRGTGIFYHNTGLLRLAAIYLEKYHPKKIRIYASHYIRGPKGLKATEEDMLLNCHKAVIHGLKLEAQFSNVDFYVPGAVDEPIVIAYRKKYLTERQILDVDCSIIDTCQAMLLLIWGDHLSQGMQVEVDHAKAHNIPIFRTDEPKYFKEFVEELCQEN